jgi:hypothetical protein
MNNLFCKEIFSNILSLKEENPNLFFINIKNNNNNDNNYKDENNNFINNNIIKSKRKIYNTINKNYLISEIKQNFNEEKHNWKLNENENILQYKSIKQKFPTNCGYHCLYDIYLIFLILEEENSDNAIKLFEKTFFNRTSFYSFQVRIKNLLLKNIKEEWSESDIERDLIDREYLEFIYNNTDIFSKYKENLFSFPDIYKNAIIIGVLSLNQILKIEKIFERIKNSNNTIFGIFLGAINHW